MNYKKAVKLPRWLLKSFQAVQMLDVCYKVSASLELKQDFFWFWRDTVINGTRNSLDWIMTGLALKSEVGKGDGALKKEKKKRIRWRTSI